MTFRHHITHSLLGLSLTVLAAGCSSDDFAGASSAKGSGGLDPQIALNSEVLAAKRPQKAMSRAEYSDITAADLSLRLTSADGSFTKAWDKIADFDASERFNVGSYTLEAFYGDEASEGFESPYFYGSQTVTVEDNKVTPVAITAELANAMVSLDYTENFTSYMTSYDAEVHSAGGATTAVTASETRPVYVKTGLVEVYVNFVKPDGKGAKLLSASFTAKPRCHYRVTFDLAEGQTSGEAVLKVIYDEMLDEQDVEIELNDELFNSPAPEVTAKGFVSGEALRFVPGNATVDEPLGIDIVARGGIARVNMTTRSASLLAQGWPAEVNLAGAPADIRTKLASLGLNARGLYTNPEKLAVVTLTDVLDHITLVEGDDGVSEITFVAIDLAGKASDAVTLRIEAAPLAVSLDNPSILFVGQTEMQADLHYNGGNPEGKVKIQYYNDRATWTDAAYTAVPANSVAGDDLYRVTITGLPVATGALRLRAVAGSLLSEEVTVDRMPAEVTLAANDADAFARRATVSASLPADAPAGIDINPLLAAGRLMLSTDGGSTYSAATATVADGKITATGLTPSTTYTARFEIEGSEPSAPVTFTTEAATQLPNSDMESWYREAGQTNYWWVDYPGADANAVWGTLNKLTTSAGGSSTGWINHTGTSYCAFSGTRPTGSGFEDRGIANGSINHEKARNGQYAAVISTVGWGDNDANGTTTIGKGCKHLTVGELYLGTYNTSSQAADYTGLAFGSRPDALSFYYYYCKKNQADYGYVEVSVVDAAGNKLASGHLDLIAAADYTLATIPLTYAADAAKAARIYVQFKSSGNPDCQTVNNDNLSCPDFSNTTSGRFTGSELFVDDIELTY